MIVGYGVVFSNRLHRATTGGLVHAEVEVRYVGLDVHKDSIVIAVAEPGRSAAREIGTVPGAWRSLEKRLGRLADGHRLVICYEAGPTGFELHRRLQQAGYESQVVAPR
ncbi:MAG: hypothetical protein R3C02_13410 [Planctomycetaceae bacterium]